MLISNILKGLLTCFNSVSSCFFWCLSKMLRVIQDINRITVRDNVPIYNQNISKVANIENGNYII